jgi:CSLREA domain-containing protein
VTTEADALANDQQCSLREAVIAANTDSAQGGCRAGNGTDTIEIPAGMYARALGGPNENAAATGDLDIVANVTLHGAGAGSTKIDAKRMDRVFEVASGVTARIEGLTITGGKAPAGGPGASTAPFAASGTPGQDGGGVLNQGTLTIVASTVTDNLAGDGGKGGTADNSLGGTGGVGYSGGGGQGGGGGGIYTSGTLTLTGVTVSANSAGSGGPAGTGIGAGAADGPGGEGTSLPGGSGGAGGGVDGAGSGTTTLTDTTISGNHAGPGAAGGSGTGGHGSLGGGPVDGPGGGDGGAGFGGIGGSGGNGGGLALDGPLTLSQSTISANTSGAGGHGGSGQGGTGGAAGAGGGGKGGAGGTSTGGGGGSGGDGGGIYHTGTLTSVDVTVTGNVTGTGAMAGTGTGGPGGPGGSPNGNGGKGGNGTGGSGGYGGNGAGLRAVTLDMTHGTISSNTAGAASAGASGSGGAGGAKDGSGAQGAPGSSIQGGAGVNGSGGGIRDDGTGTLTSSILASNGPTNCAGSFADGGYDIDFPESACPGAMIDPLLGSLGANGGPTATQALAPGSPAIDLVPIGMACQATDQRGMARPVGAGCDAGAYEVAPPLATTRPPQDGKMTGTVTPNLRSTQYHFDYGPATTYGSSTTPQDAGAGTSSVAVTAPPPAIPAGTSLHYRLVATSADGTSAGEDRVLVAGPGAGVPVLTRVSLSTSVFTVGSKRTPVSARARRHKRGTTIRFTLSEPATVKIAIQRAAAGRRKGKRCVKPTRKLRKAKNCTRYNGVGTLTRTGKAGANKVAFSGRIGTRKLTTGTYRAVLGATDAAGNHSTTRTVKFRIVRL